MYAKNDPAVAAFGYLPLQLKVKVFVLVVGDQVALPGGGRVYL